MLDQLKNLPPTAVSVRETITQNFNENEQVVLFNYFANETASSSFQNLMGDVYAFDIISFNFGTIKKSISS